MERREVYTTQQPDGTYVTTTTRTQTKYAEVLPESLSSFSNYSKKLLLFQDKVYGCGIGQTNKYYCCGPYGILRILEIVSADLLSLIYSYKLYFFQLLCLILISLITSVFGPGPFKGAWRLLKHYAYPLILGILFGQTLLLIFAGIAMCLTFIFLIVYFFTLNETHLDFWPWRTT
ncbi:unnamed protein product, partial [Strongylus vulgaris]